MEIIKNLISNTSSMSIFELFLKAFVVLFSFGYLVYAIVITRQTQELNKTYTSKNSGILIFISALQVILGVVLVLATLAFI